MTTIDTMPSRQTDASAVASIRVFLVDDHELVRDGLRLLISSERDLDVCGEAADEASAMVKVCELQPDIVIVDLTLSDGNGLKLIKWIRKNYPDLKIIVATMHNENVYAERTFRAGASGYVNKQDPARTILKALRCVLAGETYFSETLTKRMVQCDTANADPPSSPMDTLADRELEVFLLIGQGLATGKIAESLDVSPRTVETYRKRLKKKLNVASGAQLTRRAVEWLIENR